MSPSTFRRLFPAVIVAAVVGLTTSSAPANAAPVEYGASCTTTGTAAVRTNHPSGVYLWKLSSGARLDPGQYCQWGRTKLIMQTNGNLQVLDELGDVRWTSTTRGRGHHALLQADGNFVVFSSTNRPVWSSYTSPLSGLFLAVQTDGNVVLYNANWTPYWATETEHAGSGGLPPEPTATATATPPPPATPTPPPAPTATTPPPPSVP